MSQIELFPATAPLPEGFLYQREFISSSEEAELIAALETLHFGPVEMHGVVAKRRVVHYGRDYEYNRETLRPGAALPPFLVPLQQRVAELTGRAPHEFAEALVTDYPAGAGIGWHRDAPAFEIVVGVSLLSECAMQLRPWPVAKNAHRRTKPLAQVLEPRSVYVLTGASRAAWQHHIPPAKSRRLSITFRTLRSAA